MRVQRSFMFLKQAITKAEGKFFAVRFKRARNSARVSRLLGGQASAREQESGERKGRNRRCCYYQRRWGAFSWERMRRLTVFHKEKSQGFRSGEWHGMEKTSMLASAFAATPFLDLNPVGSLSSRTR